MRRRNFLLNSLAAVSLAASTSPRLHAESAEGRRVTLVPADQSLFRVRVEMDLKGNIHLSRNELVSKDRDRQVPIDYNSVIDFEERVFGDNGQGLTGARRYYHEARSEGKTAGTPQRIELRDSARHVATHMGQGRSVTYATRAYLTHEELDLLEIPVNSLAVDGMLPADAIAVDETYAVPAEAVGRLLDIDAVQDSEIEGKLTSLDNKTARLEFKGNVQGSVAGVPTMIDLAGKISFDLDSRTCTWVAMAIRERREIGKAEPGFEIAATIKMIRKPLSTAAAVSEQPLAEAPPEGQLLVNLYSIPGRYGVLMDRQWQMIRQSTSLSRLRMVENDRDIAQCDVRHLPPLKPGEQLTAEALQADVRRSLGDQFDEFLQVSEQVNSSDLRVVRLHAIGAVQRVPVQWVFAHCSDDNGRRILATFTMAAENVEAFAGADEQFVHSLRFLDLDTAAEADSPETPQAAAEPEQQTAALNAPQTTSSR
ncbi:hypothetical protein [Roseimaritima ulvae]|nr:hypothetical protein [Roseimaritima ulvae]